jgi:hypothetical protein
MEAMSASLVFTRPALAKPKLRLDRADPAVLATLIKLLPRL